MSLLEVTDLTKTFGVVNAVDGVSFSLGEGEWLAILGPSGSGKSTLLHCVAQLQEPDGGRIVLDGRDVTRPDSAERARLRREVIGIVFQQFHLLPYLDAVENVMLAQYFHSTSDRGEAVAALARVGLSHRLKHLPRELSGGEQQRVCIARALINKPRLLLADEPTGSLDRASQDGVLDLLSELHREGHSLITVTHHPDVGRRADRELILEHGRVSGAVSGARDADAELDRLLERARDLVEEGTPLTRSALSRGASRRAFEAASSGTWFHVDADRWSFTAAGDARAREAMRRRRLAERLVQQALHEGSHVGDAPCGSGHALTADAVDGACAFLGHPRTCPHGRAIPPGPCCE